MMCYGLDRFSENIDLDSTDENIIPYITQFCSQFKYTFNINKNTNTVKRCMIHYGKGKPLKVEVSYRNKVINNFDIDRINGITVYKADKILQLKCAAYLDRDKIRDLYDVVFIILNYTNQLSPQTLSLVQTAFGYKGFEQFDYLVSTQSDELIDNDKLADGFLKAWQILGLN